MMEVKVIKPGSLVRDKNGLILDARSSVVLVKGGDKNIIVDTGFPGEEEIIIQGLKAERLSPDDIEIVINTHLHNDHTGNNHLFKKARFIAHEKENPGSEYHIVRGSYEVDRNIEIFETPGHTHGSVSVSVKADKIYVITGDALPTEDNYLKWVPPGINIGSRIALLSMEKIVDVGDIIIPGHDRRFEI